jgi:hypothetical protein
LQGVLSPLFVIHWHVVVLPNVLQMTVGRGAIKDSGDGIGGCGAWAIISAAIARRCWSIAIRHWA